MAPLSKATSGNYQNMTSAPILPNYLGLPFRILVSPFVNFDPENRVTDIMMFNSRNLGALIVDEDPHVKSWEDGQYNILNMSIEETYGFGHPQRRPGHRGRQERQDPSERVRHAGSAPSSPYQVSSFCGAANASRAGAAPVGAKLDSRHRCRTTLAIGRGDVLVAAGRLTGITFWSSFRRTQILVW
jgi:hypothetical protein